MAHICIVYCVLCIVYGSHSCTTVGDEMSITYDTCGAYIACSYASQRVYLACTECAFGYTPESLSPFPSAQDDGACDPIYFPLGFPTICVALTLSPSTSPTPGPTLSPTIAPTIAPTKTPTPAPSASPTTPAPTLSPTIAPTIAPTKTPTPAPTQAPSIAPTKAPTMTPTLAPTMAPTPWYGCKEKCWTGMEDCCERITTNIFVTSRLTERILFFDFHDLSYKLFLSNQETQSCPMSRSPGANHIAFSPTGDEIYATRSSDGATPGAIEAYHAQSSQHTHTLLSALHATPDPTAPPFSPGVLRTHDSLLLFSDQSTGTLYAAPLAANEISTPVLLYTAPADCLVVDVAIPPREDPADPPPEEYRLFVLTRCAADTSIIQVTVTSSLTSPTTLPQSINIQSEFPDPRSLEFYTATSFYVAVGGTGPYLLQYAVDFAVPPSSPSSDPPAISLIQTLITDTDFDGERYGVDLQMIRRAPNGLIYASDGTFGLPLIIDPGMGTIIGQTGRFFGFLADSYAMAFSPNAYGLNSVLELHLPDIITAGEDYEFTITTIDANKNPVTSYTDLKAILSTPWMSLQGFPSNTLSESAPGDIKQDPTSLTLYHGVFTPERASMSLEDSGHKSTLSIALANLDMQIGKSEQFWVTPGPTAATTSYVNSTFETASVLDPVRLFVRTLDKFGNHRVFNSPEEIAAEAAKLSVESANYTVTPVSSGLYEIAVSTKKAAAYNLEVAYDGEPVANSPVSIVFLPSHFDPDQSLCVGISLDRFSYGEASFNVLVKDEFSNIVSSEKPAVTIAGWTINWEEGPLELIDVEVAVEAVNDGSFRVSYMIERDDFFAGLKIDARVHGQPLSFISSSSESSKERTLLDGDWVSRPETRIKYRKIPQERYVAITAGSSAMILYILVCASLVFRWRNENAIKFSQRRLLYVILTGILMVMLTILSLTIPRFAKSKYSCVVFAWGGLSGFWLVNLVLAAKTFRVQKLAYATVGQRVKITDFDLLKRIFAGMVLLWANLIVWTVLEPPTLKKFVSDHYTRDRYGTKTYYEIDSCDLGAEWAYYPLGVETVVLIGYVSFLATQSRKIPSAFSESKWIALSLYTFVALMALGGSIVNIDNIQFENPEFYLTVICIVPTLSSCAFVTFLFVPKFHSIVKGKMIDMQDLTFNIDREREKEKAKSGKSGGGGVQMARITSTNSATNVSTAAQYSASSVGMSSIAIIDSNGTGNPIRDADVTELKEQNKMYKNEVMKLRAELSSEKKKLGSIREAEGGAKNGGRIPEDEDWAEYHDDQGYSYYFNKKTDECTYDMPSKW